MTSDAPTYRSYLLRLWQTTNQQSTRASLYNVHDPTEQHHFATIDDLYMFLRSAPLFAPDTQTQGNGATNPHP